MMAAQHELSSFAVGVTVSSALGVPPLGCLLWGAICAGAGDLPDIDSPRARIVKMLFLFPYRVPKLDKNGQQMRTKPRPISATGRAKGPTKGKARAKAKKRAKRKLFWLSVWSGAWRGVAGWIAGDPVPQGEPIWVWRVFPGHQLHRLSVRASEAVYDRFATEADRRDVIPKIGLRFRSHRGLTHSVWAAGIVGFLGWILGEIVGLVVGGWSVPTVLVGGWSVPTMFGLMLTVGMLSHIGGDACTDMGVSPFAPLIEWRGKRYPVMGIWTPMRFKAGQWVEEGPVSWACTGLAVLAVLGAFGLVPFLVDAAGRVWSALG